MKSETTNKMLAITIPLPSGISSGRFTVKASGNGWTLEVKIKWPDTFVYVKNLRRKWIDSTGLDHMEVYHPKLIGFEHNLKSHRKKRSKTIVYNSKIGLIIRIQTHIFEKHNLAWSDTGAKVVYNRVSSKDLTQFKNQ